MKTSNKLLLGLFALIIVIMIIGNIVLKSEAKKNVRIEKLNETTSQTDTVSADSTTIHINIK